MNYRSLRMYRRHRPPVPPVIPPEKHPEDYPPPFFREFTRRAKDELASVEAARILAAQRELAAAEQTLADQAAAIDRRITRVVRPAAATVWVLCLFDALAALAGYP